MMNSRLVLQETWGQIERYPGFWVQVLMAIAIPLVILQIGLTIFQRNLQTEMLGRTADGIPSALPPTSISYYIVLFIGSWIISLLARILIMGGVKGIEEKSAVTIQSLLLKGWPKVRKLVGVDLILVMPFAVVYMVITFMLMSNIQSTFGAIQNGNPPPTSPPAAFALIPLLICMNFLITIPLAAWTLFASNAAIMEENRALSSIKTGLTFLRTNSSSVIRLSLLLLILCIILAIIMAVVLAPISVAALTPMQRAMADCMNSTENLEASNACMQQVQQAPLMQLLQLVSVLISGLSNSVLLVIVLMSTSLLFYRSRSVTLQNPL